MRHSISQPQDVIHIQSHKAAQLRLLEIVEFPIKSISLALMSLLPLIMSVLMQCKSVVMQLEAR